MNKTPKRRLLQATATIGITTMVGLGVTAAFGQVGAAESQATVSPAASLVSETVGAPSQTASNQVQAPAIEANQTSATESSPSETVTAVDAGAISEIVDLFYNPGEVVQHDCVLVTEQGLLADLAPEGVNPDNVWLQPDGPEWLQPGISAELGEDTDEQIVLKEYDQGVVTYDVAQDIIVTEFAPCLDTETALEVVMASPVASLASIYHEASLTTDGSVQVLFRVSKTDRYTPETFEGEFSGILGSADYEGFLDTMPESVRSQVEVYANSLEGYVTG